MYLFKLYIFSQVQTKLTKKGNQKQYKTKNVLIPNDTENPGFTVSTKHNEKDVFISSIEVKKFILSLKNALYISIYFCKYTRYFFFFTQLEQCLTIFEIKHQVLSTVFTSK